MHIRFLGAAKPLKTFVTKKEGPVDTSLQQVIRENTTHSIGLEELLFKGMSEKDDEVFFATGACINGGNMGWKYFSTLSTKDFEDIDIALQA